MIAITFRGKSLDEVMVQIRAAGQAANSHLAQATTGELKLTTERVVGASPALAAPYGESTMNADGQESAPVTKRTRKSKTETTVVGDASVTKTVTTETSQPAASALATPPAPAVQSTTAPAAPIEKAQLVAMLQKVNEKGGMPKAREVLSRFSVSRISDLPKERYPDFLDECAKAIA